MKEKQRRNNKVVQPSIYEYKTPYQSNVEKFSAEVADNSRKIKESENSPQPQRKPKAEEPNKKVSKQTLLAFN